VGVQLFRADRQTDVNSPIVAFCRNIAITLKLAMTVQTDRQTHLATSVM